MIEPAELLTAFNTTAGPQLYQRLKAALSASIESRRLGPDAALPSERDIAQALRISRITVRKAIDGLVEEGRLVRKHGSGTYVAGRVEKSFSTLSSFTEDMRARGRTVRSEWLMREGGQVSPEEALSLSLSPGTPVYRFHRIRFADDVAMALEYSTVPASCLASEVEVKDSLYDVLRRRNLHPVRALQRLRAVLLAEGQAALLGVEAGSPALLIERIGFAANGGTVESTRSFYRGDAYDFVAELGLAS